MGNLAGWNVRKQIAILGSVSGAQTNYALKLTVHYGSGTDSTTDIYCNGLVKTDFSDIRMTAADGTTVLSYWAESIVNSGRAIIWVKIPSLSASPATLATYLYYGNATALSAESGSSTFAFFDDFTAQPTPVVLQNATNYFNLITRDSAGTLVTAPADINQGTHPTVVDMGTAWCEYRYWMVFTPYPNTQSAYENPTLLVSNDNVTWVEHAGVANPLAPKPGGFNSDPDMVYDAVNDRMIIYYRQDETCHYITITNSGGTPVKAAHAVLITSTAGYQSPTVVKTATGWRMYWLKIADWKMYYLDAVDPIAGFTLANMTTFTITTYTPSTTTALTSSAIWHMDIIYDAAIGWVMVYCTDNNSAKGFGNLYLATSTDGVAWVKQTNAIMYPTGSGWDKGFLYRTSISYDSGSGDLRLWYSTSNGTQASDSKWYIGYTSGNYSNILAQSGANGTSWIPFYQAATAQPEWGFLTGQNGPAYYNKLQSSKFSAVSNAGYQNKWNKTIPAMTAHELSYRFYDNMSAIPNTSKAYIFGLQGTVGLSVGVITANDAVYYSYYKGNNSTVSDGTRTSSTVARSVGWHDVKIQITGTTANILIDGVAVVTGTTGITASMANLVLRASNYNNPNYISDVRIRPYVAAEPAISTVGILESFSSSLAKSLGRLFGSFGGSRGRLL